MNTGSHPRPQPVKRTPEQQAVYDAADEERKKKRSDNRKAAQAEAARIRKRNRIALVVAIPLVIAAAFFGNRWQSERTAAHAAEVARVEQATRDSVAAATALADSIAKAKADSTAQAEAAAKKPAKGRKR